MVLLQLENLSSTNRLIILSLEIALSFLCLEFFLLFFERFSKKRNINGDILRKPEDSSNSKHLTFQNYFQILQFRELSWGILFFLLGMMIIMQIIGDFYIVQDWIKLMFAYARNLNFLLALSLFSYSLETSELKSNHFLISKILGSLSGITLLIMLVWPEFSEICLYISLPFTLFILIQYGRVTFLRTKELMNFRYPFFILFFGLLLFIAGFFVTRGLFIPIFESNGRLAGDVIQFFGIFACGIAFFFLPSLDELNWLDKLYQLYVIHPLDGLCLYSYNFKSQATEAKFSLESDLTTSIILSINTIAQEIAEKEKSGIDVIHKDDFTIILEFGPHCICAIIAAADSLTLRKKIHLFCSKFEEKYSQYLIDWSGNTSRFLETSKIVKEVFHPDSKEENSKN